MRRAAEWERLKTALKEKQITMAEKIVKTKVADEGIQPVDEMIELQTGREILSVTLTNSDRLERGEGIAKNLGEMDEVNSKFNEEKAKAKAQLEFLHRLNALMSQELRQGYSKQSIDIEEIKDFRAGTISKIRLDTNEVFHSRELSPSERQRGMNL